MMGAIAGLLFYSNTACVKRELRFVCDMGEWLPRDTHALGVDRKGKPVSRLAKQRGTVNVSK